MSNWFSNTWTAVCRNPYPVLLTLFVVWTCIGIFPLPCYEEDGQEILLGCDVMYREGWTLPPVYSYEYRMQPLTTILVVLLKYLLPFMTCEQIYGIMTALFSLAFLLGCISFAHHITKESKTTVLVAAMLLPEMYAIAMYANTAIPAATLIVWAYILIVRQRYWLAGLLLSVALLFRLDAVIVYPSILPLFYFEGKSLKQSILLSMAFAVGVAIVSLSLFWLVGADALSTYDGYDRWSNIITIEDTLKAVWGFYSLAYVFLLPLGLYLICRSKRWRELFLVAFPLLSVHLFYAEMGNASKHFLYCAPFAMMAGARALTWIVEVLRNRPVMKWCCILVTVLYLTISVRPYRWDAPWVQNSAFHNVGVVVPLGHYQPAGKSISLGVGAGKQILTGDEFMLDSGHLFYSWYMHSIKDYIKQWRQAEKEGLDNAGTCNVLTFEYAVSAPISSAYLNEGYHFRQLENMPKHYRFTISGEGRDIHFWRVFLSGDETNAHDVAIWLKSLSASKEGAWYALAAPSHFGVWHVLDELSETGQVENKGGNLYKIISAK